MLIGRRVNEWASVQMSKWVGGFIFGTMYRRAVCLSVFLNISLRVFIIYDMITIYTKIRVYAVRCYSVAYCARCRARLNSSLTSVNLFLFFFSIIFSTINNKADIICYFFIACISKYDIT